MTVAEDMGFLMTWGNWMCMWPKREDGVFRATTWRSYFSIVIILLAFVYSVFGRLTEDYYASRKMFIKIGMISTSVLTICNVDAIVGSFTWKVQRVQKLFDDFQELDGFLAVQGFSFEKKSLRLTIVFALVNVYVVSMLIFEVIWWEDEIYYFQFVLLDRLMVYGVFVVNALDANVLRHLRSRLESINKMIEKTDDERDVEAIAKFHALFLDLIETFNCIQGWHFFYTMIICILFTLIIVQDMLEPDFVWDTQVFLLYISWFAFVYAQGVFVATMCEQVSEEGKKTITISYKALNKYSNVPALREKLFILAQQATARCPKFTAAGFFNVDFSMLFTFVNLITTYVIVIIQFS